MKHRTGFVDQKATSIMKLEEDHHSIILGGNACSMRCEGDWFQKFGDQAVDHFGRIHEPKKLVPENAWYKDNDYDWRSSSYSNWRMINRLTKEVRPITEEQYDDDSFTMNTR